MTEPHRAPRPPTVAGTVPLRWIDGLRILGWTEIGYIHAAVRGSVVAGLFSMAWVLSIPVLLLAQPFIVARRNARYYMTPERDAVLAVVTTKDGWKIDDHLSATPATGQGAVLRAILLTDLVTTADHHQLTIHATAAHPKLMARYITDLPGLVDVGRAWPRGRKLRRQPAAGLSEPVDSTSYIAPSSSSPQEDVAFLTRPTIHTITPAVIPAKARFRGPALAVLLGTPTA